MRTEVLLQNSVDTHPNQRLLFEDVADLWREVGSNPSVYLLNQELANGWKGYRSAFDCRHGIAETRLTINDQS